MNRQPQPGRSAAAFNPCSEEVRQTDRLSGPSENEVSRLHLKASPSWRTCLELKSERASITAPELRVSMDVWAALPPSSFGTRKSLANVRSMVEGETAPNAGGGSIRRRSELISDQISWSDRIAICGLYQFLGHEQPITRWKIHQPIACVVTRGADFHGLDKLFRQRRRRNNDDPLFLDTLHYASSLSPRQFARLLTPDPSLDRALQKPWNHKLRHAHLIFKECGHPHHIAKTRLSPAYRTCVLISSHLPAGWLARTLTNPAAPTPPAPAAATPPAPGVPGCPTGRGC